MQLSTTISPYYRFSDGSFHSIPDAIRDCVRMGFTVLDFPFHSVPFLADGEDWKTPVQEAKAVAESLGARFRYAHVPFSYPSPDDTDGWAYFTRRVNRAIEACAILGVEWTAIHPYDMAIPDYDADAAFERSINHLTPFAHLAKECGVGLAVENMVDRVLVPYRRYCATAENLNAVVDALREKVGAQTIGICLDTGHANACGLNHAAAIRAFGERLKMLHINDNFGLSDDHCPPFTATVNWKRLMLALREIEYPGDFNYEVDVSRIPSDACAARDAYVGYLVEIGKYLIAYEG